MLRKDTRNWIASAEYDLETVIHMMDSGRYLYVVFLCHLDLEKMLKAHVTEVTQSVPAKSHDLVYLLKKSDLEVSESFLDFIGKINTASIPTRYPEDLQSAIRDYPQEVAEDYFRQTEEIVQWLRQHPNLNL